MNTLLATIVVLAALLLVYRMRRVRRGQAGAPGPGRYRCVRIVSEEGACAWVAKLEGRPLLPFEARLFPLPLPECDAAHCRCRYVHCEDRRDDDRRIPYAPRGRGASARAGAGERRSGTDRRQALATDSPPTRDRRA